MKDRADGPKDLRCSAGDPEHVTCTHYRHIEDRVIVVGKDELYDYCTNDPED